MSWNARGEMPRRSNASKLDTEKPAAMVMPGTSIYQFTEVGLALQAIFKVTKFLADSGYKHH